MEFECPDPMPRIRNLPKGVSIDDAFCIFGHVVLHVVLDIPSGAKEWEVFYNPPSSPGFNFVSPCTLAGFQEVKDNFRRLAADPAYGQKYIDSYFAGQGGAAAEAIAKGARGSFNLQFGLPGWGV